MIKKPVKTSFGKTLWVCTP